MNEASRQRLKLLKAHEGAQNMWQSAAEGDLNSKRELRALVDQIYADVPEVVRDVIEHEATELVSAPTRGLDARNRADEKAIEWASRIAKADRIREDVTDDDGLDPGATAGSVQQGNDPAWMDDIRFEDGTGLRSGDDQ